MTNMSIQYYTKEKDVACVLLHFYTRIRENITNNDDNHHNKCKFPNTHFMSFNQTKYFYPILCEPLTAYLVTY